REELARRLVARGAAPERIAALPRALMSFRIEPAVELDVAQRNVHVAKLIAHREQRSGISERFLEPVVIRRAVIGPIAEILQADIGIVGGALLAGEIGEEMAPGLEGAIDAARDHQRARRHEAWRDVLAVGGYPADQLTLRTERQFGVHVMGGRREN